MLHSQQKAATTFLNLINIPMSYFERTTLLTVPIWIKMTFLRSIMMVGNDQIFIYKLP